MKELFNEKESNVRSYCRKYNTVFSKAKGSLLFDTDGRQYIDFFSGAGALNYGHNPPHIKEKIIQYLKDDNIIHALDFHTKAKYDFIKKFYSVILEPRQLDYKIMFTGPTGTNAVEAALKLARKVTKRQTVLAFAGAFHGMSLGSLAVTTDKVSREGAGVSLNDVIFIPFESGGGYKIDSLDYFEHLLQDDHSGIQKPAAVIFETIQAEGGVNVASMSWLRRLKGICKRNGILLICDDIQVGVGVQVRFSLLRSMTLNRRWSFCPNHFQDMAFPCRFYFLNHSSMCGSPLNTTERLEEINWLLLAQPRL